MIVDGDVVAVVGSRDYFHLERVTSFVRNLPPRSIVVSGGARGVDRAAECAPQYGHHLKLFTVESFEWTRLGNKAGPARNEVIVRYIQTHKGKVHIFCQTTNYGAPATPGSLSLYKLCQMLSVPYTIHNDWCTDLCAHPERSSTLSLSSGKLTSQNTSE